MPSIAEQIARIVLENSAGPYCALASTQHHARQRVIEAAAKLVQTILEQNKAAQP